MICIKKVFTSPSFTQGICYIPSFPNEWICLIGKKTSVKKRERKKNKKKEKKKRIRNGAGKPETFKDTNSPFHITWFLRTTMRIKIIVETSFCRNMNNRIFLDNECFNFFFFHYWLKLTSTITKLRVVHDRQALLSDLLWKMVNYSNMINP